MSDTELTRRTIVAEISKNWPQSRGTDPRTMSQKFEDVIEYNRQRGYRLESWRMGNAIFEAGSMIETIIAVFELNEGECVTKRDEDALENDAIREQEERYQFHRETLLTPAEHQ